MSKNLFQTPVAFYCQGSVQNVGLGQVGAGSAPALGSSSAVGSHLACSGCTKTIFVFVSYLSPSQLCFFSTRSWLTSTRSPIVITSWWSVQSALGCLFGVFVLACWERQGLPLCSHHPWGLTLSTKKSPGHWERPMWHTRSGLSLGIIPAPNW